MALRAIRTFHRDERGAVAAIYAISVIGLVAVAGVGFDYTRMAALDSELQNAADQAALAGATQLNREGGACARAGNASIELLRNITLLANDGAASGNEVTVSDGTTITVADDECASFPGITFYEDKEKTTVAATDEDARFIEVAIDARTANYAFTPIVGLLSATMNAQAMAGVGSAICRVPPMMICSPDPSQDFNAAAKKGWGIQVTAKGSSAWAPGDFGFLEVGDGQKADLERALAFDQTTYDCAPVEGSYPQTGNAQGLFRAINTRFDMYDTSGNPLGNCQSGDCPPAQNVLKDLVKPNTNTNGNACKTHNQGWQLPPVNRQFWPKNRSATSGTPLEQVNDTVHSPSIDAMGLGRDLCHYASYATLCTTLTGLGSSRFGNGDWARGDYFAKYHSGREPGNASTMTRYETYLWELDNGYQTSLSGSSAGSGGNQYSAPVCAAPTSDIDRRVLTVAIVKNCSSLSGSSTAVEVDEWVDVFLVEPVFDARGNGALADGIYMEIIRPATLGTGEASSTTQTIRKDKPYLIE